MFTLLRLVFPFLFPTYICGDGGPFGNVLEQIGRTEGDMKAELSALREEVSRLTARVETLEREKKAAHAEYLRECGLV